MVLSCSRCVFNGDFPDAAQDRSAEPVETVSSANEALELLLAEDQAFGPARVQALQDTVASP